jgi:hypothetical protein
LGRENPYKDISKDNSGAAEQQPVNPALNDVSDKEKHIAAVHLTNVILDSYEQLHVFANMALPISKKKVNKLVAEGELDLSIQVPYDAGKHMSAGELIETYNEQVKDALTVSEEFKETVRPPLIRVLEKSGAGMSDGQFIIYAFGKDIAVKGIQVYQIKKNGSDIVDSIREYTAAYREGMRPSGSPVSQNEVKRDTEERSHTVKKEKQQRRETKYEEPEESVQTIIPPDFGNKETMDLINRTHEEIHGKSGAEDDSSASWRTKKGRGGSNKNKHYSSGQKNSGRKKKSDIQDAEIIDENPLD